MSISHSEPFGSPRGKLGEESIEDIVLDGDHRGMVHLRPYLSPDFCEEAARLVMDTTGPVLIATGFYIIAVERPESDGPPGAMAIGRALQALGRQIYYVTDRVSLSMMQGLAGGESQVIDFPIADDGESRQFADELLARLNPGLLISIERCGLNRSSTYLNMRGRDITPFTARLDYLFTHHPDTVGIGDGGNEIGMGNLADQIRAVDALPDDPAVTRVSRLVICNVSNWGGYGLVAALSRLVGRNLLPTVEEEAALVRRAVDLGAVDGITGESRYTVDTYGLKIHGKILSRLHRLLGDQGVRAG